MILGLDLSSITGWSLPHTHGQWQFRGTRPAKLLQLHDRLGTILLEHPEISLCVYERPFSRGQAATRMLWGMAAVVELTCEAYEVPTVDVLPTTLKKYFTGTGNASKTDMIDMAEIYLGERVSDHTADAMAARLWATQDGHPQ